MRRLEQRRSNGGRGIPDDEECGGRVLQQLALDGLDSAGSAQLGEHIAGGGEDDRVPDATRALTQCQRQKALPDARGSDQQNVLPPLDSVAGPWYPQRCPRDRRIEVEVFQRPLAFKAGSARAQAKLLAVPSLHFVVQHVDEELRQQQVLLAGLLAASFPGLQYDGHAKLLEQRGQFVRDVHSSSTG